MATDATGTPTSLGIPKFNTAVDPPSGLGSNAQMDAIDALLVAKAPKPASAGVKVWDSVNGEWDDPTGTPTGAKFLRDDGTWQLPAPVTYRKNSLKTVSGTVTETDLLNGEITIAAGAMGANGALRGTLFVLATNNTGGVQSAPRFKLKLGGNTLIDTNALGNWAVALAAWRIDIHIQNLASVATQFVDFRARAMSASAGLSATTFATGNGFGYITAASGGVGELFYEGNNTSSVDTSTAKALELTVINGSSSASYSSVLYSALMEII